MLSHHPPAPIYPFLLLDPVFWATPTQALPHFPKKLVPATTTAAPVTPPPPVAAAPTANAALVVAAAAALVAAAIANRGTGSDVMVQMHPGLSSTRVSTHPYRATLPLLAPIDQAAHRLCLPSHHTALPVISLPSLGPNLLPAQLSTKPRSPHLPVLPDVSRLPLRIPATPSASGSHQPCRPHRSHVRALPDVNPRRQGLDNSIATINQNLRPSPVDTGTLRIRQTTRALFPRTRVPREQH